MLSSTRTQYLVCLYLCLAFVCKRAAALFSPCSLCGAVVQRDLVKVNHFELMKLPPQASFLVYIANWLKYSALHL